jgi:hypothetical protein
MRNILWIAGLGALIWIGAHAAAAVVSPLMTAFHATGARPQGYSINDWVQLHNKGSIGRVEAQTAAKLHVSGPVHRTVTSTYVQVSQSARDAGENTRVIAETLSTGASFLVIDRSSPHGLSGITAAQTLFSGILKPLGRLHSDINLEGSIAGRLSRAQENAIINKSLQAIGANDVNGIDAKGYVSMSAATPFIKSADRLQGHPVNVQVALSYNPYLHATTVYVGTPLITVTY